MFMFTYCRHIYFTVRGTRMPLFERLNLQSNATNQ